MQYLYSGPEGPHYACHDPRPRDVRRSAGLEARRFAIDAAVTHHSTSIATASSVTPSISGSVIGVLCRYSRFGLITNTNAAAAAGQSDSVTRDTIQAIAPAAIANDRTEMTTADAPL